MNVLPYTENDESWYENHTIPFTKKEMQAFKPYLTEELLCKVIPPTSDIRLRRSSRLDSQS